VHADAAVAVGATSSPLMIYSNMIDVARLLMLLKCIGDIRCGCGGKIPVEAMDESGQLRGEE
jgi:hypothetical protein